ncbi:MAG: hypothetical protein AB7V77_02925 [Candidatus Woesearchaeota archaeon]
MLKKTILLTTLLAYATSLPFFSNKEENKQNLKFNLDISQKLNKFQETKSNLENEEQKKLEKYLSESKAIIYSNEKEFFEKVDFTKKGLFIIMNKGNEQKFFVDGLGYGKYDKIIDCVSQNNDFVVADSLEYYFLKHFKKGFSNKPNYFIEDLNKLQEFLLEQLKLPLSESSPKKVIFEDVETYGKNTEILLYKDLLVFLQPSKIVLQINENNLTSVEYNENSIPEIYEKLYTTAKSFSF